MSAPSENDSPVQLNKLETSPSRSESIHDWWYKQKDTSAMDFTASRSAGEGNVEDAVSPTTEIQSSPSMPTGMPILNMPPPAISGKGESSVTPKSQSPGGKRKLKNATYKPSKGEAQARPWRIEGEEPAAPSPAARVSVTPRHRKGQAISRSGSFSSSRSSGASSRRNHGKPSVHYVGSVGAGHSSQDRYRTEYISADGEKLDPSTFGSAENRLDKEKSTDEDKPSFIRRGRYPDGTWAKLSAWAQLHTSILQGILVLCLFIPPLVLAGIQASPGVNWYKQEISVLQSKNAYPNADSSLFIPDTDLLKFNVTTYTWSLDDLKIEHLLLSNDTNNLVKFVTRQISFPSPLEDRVATIWLIVRASSAYGAGSAIFGSFMGILIILPSVRRRWLHHSQVSKTRGWLLFWAVQAALGGLGAGVVPLGHPQALKTERDAQLCGNSGPCFTLRGEALNLNIIDSTGTHDVWGPVYGWDLSVALGSTACFAAIILYAIPFKDPAIEEQWLREMREAAHANGADEPRQSNQSCFPCINSKKK